MGSGPCGLHSTSYSQCTFTSIIHLSTSYPFVFSSIVIPPFFGITCTWLTIYYQRLDRLCRRPTIWALPFAKPPSWIELSLVWDSLDGLSTFLTRIRCKRSVGLAPFKSVSIHPIVDLLACNISFSHASCSVSNPFFMTIGSISSSPKNTYLMCTGSCLSYTLGACSIEGGNLLVWYKHYISTLYLSSASYRVLNCPWTRLVRPATYFLLRRLSDN